MPLTIGTRLGSHEIVDALGAGGMGEVYRARDTKLGRDVAIKILPSSFAADAERLARFEREAPLLASLNHPNIGAIYGVEERDGMTALVLELVEGETLAERLAHAGIGDSGLGIRDSLAIARQVADALDAAHERGIVHRDLKPANIVVTPDGTVKVLDFGLAKAAADVGVGLQAGPADLTHSPTVIGPTMDGVLLGTAPYMSPEQARGKAVDKRTDVWAFGCVLYEMLTGRRAFGGDTTSDTIVAILEREPDWAALPPQTPSHVGRLLRRCLEKDAKRRLRDISSTGPSDDRGAGFVVDARGGVPKSICSDCGVHGFLSDNRRVLIVADRQRRVQVLDVETLGTQDAAIGGEGEIDRPHASPDDRWLSLRYKKTEAGDKVYITPLVPGRPTSPSAWLQIDEPTTTGRPCGWSLDSRVAYCLLDIDGFRCLWGQRVDAVHGRLQDKPFAVRHFHSTMLQELSTTFGNAIGPGGFLYGAGRLSGNLWRVVSMSGRPDTSK